MPLAGRATAAGTARYVARHAARVSQQHFRPCLGLMFSSIGAGTYLGALSDTADERYRQALAGAIQSGCNVLDTAVNYRAQRSELAIGDVLAELVAKGEISRDEVIVASKGGFIAYRLAPPANPMQYLYDNFFAPGMMEPEELAGGIHCMAPTFLAHQISWSLRNTGLHALDVYYIHNPETQLAFVDRNTFRRRLQLAFARLEEEVAVGRLGCYGIATWHGLRRPPMTADYLSLEKLIQLAVEVAGQDHHFKVIQAPLSIGMPEAATFRNQSVEGRMFTLLEAAAHLDLAVVASASIMQAQLPPRLSAILAETFPNLEGDVARSLQFTRSLPGISVALVGMGKIEHASENLALAARDPQPEAALRLARSLPR